MTKKNRLSTTEAAAVLHVHPQTLRDWTAAGRITAKVTAGGHRRYKATEVYTLLRRGQGFTRHYGATVAFRLEAGDEVDFTLIEDDIDSTDFDYIDENLLRTGQTQISFDPGTVRADWPVGPRAAAIYGYGTVSSFDLAAVQGAVEELMATISTWLRENVRPVGGLVGWTGPDGRIVGAPAYRFTARGLPERVNADRMGA